MNTTESEPSFHGGPGIDTPEDSYTLSRSAELEYHLARQARSILAVLQRAELHIVVSPPCPGDDRWRVGVPVVGNFSGCTLTDALAQLAQAVVL